MTGVLLAISVRNLNRWVIYLLVLSAVVVCTWVLARYLADLGRQHGEALDSEDERAGGMANSITYFISRGRLFQLQLGTGGVTAVLVVATMLVSGVWSPVLLALGAAVSGVIAGLLPLRIYQGKVKRRSLAFQAQMLDFSLGLSNGLKAGQALPQALEVYSRNCDEPLRSELRVVEREYHLGVELAEALTRMYRRIPCEDLQLMIVSIKLTVTAGGSLADVLDKMTRTIRSRDDFHRKLSALTAQGRFEAIAMSLAPVAAFLILWGVNPDLMLPMLSTGTGWAAIGVDVVLILTGYAVIRKITAVEV